MVAESTPFGWSNNNNDDIGNDPWGNWFEPVLDLVLGDGSYPIAMWSYIDCDWDAQPMWHGVGFGDTRVAQNKTVQELWQRRVVDKFLGYGSFASYCGNDDDTSVGRGRVAGTPAAAAIVPSTKSMPTAFPSWSTLPNGATATLLVLLVVVMGLVAGTLLLQRRRLGRRNARYQRIP